MKVVLNSHSTRPSCITARGLYPWTSFFSNFHQWSSWWHHFSNLCWWHNYLLLSIVSDQKLKVSIILEAGHLAMLNMLISQLRGRFKVLETWSVVISCVWVLSKRKLIKTCVQSCMTQDGYRNYLTCWPLWHVRSSFFAWFCSSSNRNNQQSKNRCLRIHKNADWFRPLLYLPFQQPLPHGQLSFPFFRSRSALLHFSFTAVTTFTSRTKGYTQPLRQKTRPVLAALHSYFLFLSWELAEKSLYKTTTQELC